MLCADNTLHWLIWFSHIILIIQLNRRVLVLLVGHRFFKASKTSHFNMSSTKYWTWIFNGFSSTMTAYKKLVSPFLIFQYSFNLGLFLGLIKIISSTFSGSLSSTSSGTRESESSTETVSSKIGFSRLKVA